MNAIDERPRDALLSDLLPYESWDEGAQILWLRDGSATQSFTITPRNVVGFTEDDLAILRSGVSSVLGQIPEGVFVQFLLVRERTSKGNDLAAGRWSAFHQGEGAPEERPRLRLVEAKENLLSGLWQEGALLQTKIYLSLRVPAEAQGKSGARTGPFSQVAFLRKRHTKLKNSSQIRQELDDTSRSIRRGLEALGFEVTPVSGTERIELIYRYLNPERAEVLPWKQRESTQNTLSEDLALTDFLETNDGLRLGRTPLRLATLKALPDSSVPCLLHGLAVSGKPFVLVITALMLPQTSERERLTRKQRLTQGLAAGNRVRNLVAENQLQEIEETLSSMISSGEKLMVASFHVISSGEDETKPASFGQLVSQAEELGPGCQWFEETVGAYPVFFGNLPFAPVFMPRPKRVLSSHLSDFLPLYGMPPGHEKAEVLFETPYQSLLGYSLFEKSPSANGILIGSTGSGKSTLACGLILEMTAGNHPEAPSCFVVDVGNSFKRTILYLGGSSLDLSPEKGTRINPFDLPPGVQKPDPEKVKFLTAFFDEVLGDQGSLSKLERALLETEILRFYELEGPKHLSRFKGQLEQSSSPELKGLARLLTLWCQPHPYGLLFDGDTNVDIRAPHLHFELKGCQRYPDLLRVAMIGVMDLIWREVRGRFPKRSIIPVDEAHTIIRPSTDGRSNPSARWVDDCARQMRKFGSAIIPISQTAKDLKNDEIGDGILANCPNRFIMKQRGDEKTLREDLKLNDEEIKAVFSLAQLRGAYSEFYLHSESFKGILVYRPTPLALWLSTTHPPDLELMEQVASKHPEWSLYELMNDLAEEFPGGAELSGRRVS